MKITKTINVTKTGIRKGIQNDAYTCPVARACVVAGLKNPAADGDVLEFKYKGEYYYGVPIPAKAKSFIEKFDKEDCVRSKLKPFSFKISFEHEKDNKGN